MRARACASVCVCMCLSACMCGFFRVQPFTLFSVFVVQDPEAVKGLINRLAMLSLKFETCFLVFFHDKTVVKHGTSRGEEEGKKV